MKLRTKQIMTLLGFMVIVGTGSAQTWTVNGVQQTNPLTSDPAVSAAAIDPITGQVAIATTTVVTPTVTVVGPPTNPAINTGFVVSWTASNFTGSVTCTPQSAGGSVTGWPTTGQSGTSGSANNVTASTPGTYTFTVSCSNGIDTQSGSRQVTVTNGGTCPSPIFDLPPPLGLSNTAVVLTGGITSWGAFFGRNFPGQPGDQGVARLDAAMYNAVAFQVPTGGFNKDISLQGVPSGTGGGTTVATFAISECPGVVRTNGKCTGFESNASIGITFSGNNFGLSNQRCLVVNGRDYYLNVANRVCDGTQCATEISLQHTTSR